MDHGDDKGTLMFQGGKKLGDEYYIVSVFDSVEREVLTFSAYELENSETYNISFPYVEFDTLCKQDPELNTDNKEARYQWIVQRLDFVSEGTNGKKLTLAAEPTPEEPDIPSATGKAIPTGRMNYMERQRQKQEMDKLDEKRAKAITEKGEKARKAFLAELQEKKRLEDLKAAARSQRIEEERQERREKEQMARRIAEEKAAKYAANNDQREARIHELEQQRKQREEKKIHDIVEEDRRAKADRETRIENARVAKRNQDFEHKQHEEAEKARLASLNEKREGAIGARMDRSKEKEAEYIRKRQQIIDDLAREKQNRQERKAKYVYEKSAERARLLKEQHDQQAEWDRLEDQRTQAELKRDHDRNMMMVEHIEKLKQERDRKEHELQVRKEASLAQRRDHETKSNEERAAKNRELAERDEKRHRHIADREVQREQRNQEYIDHIRNLKSSEEARARDKHEHLEASRQKAREERISRRQDKIEQQEQRNNINKAREDHISKRQQNRDLKEVDKVRKWKEEEQTKQLELQAKKETKRLAAREAAMKKQQEEEEKRLEWQKLEEKRQQNIASKDSARIEREQQRLGGTAITAN
eukprot:CAMPEP_0204271632 /NCGR_PEP_ID=MMETSP0468-20130131/20548_1 /ASSEMBLY_ACC=CAM_ASM_000383 /TAXON_ID=2969 /ORGANISM="Oxyrrhis marina" /LENGTH=588 /DNA_ID=CAMNT_0051247353 /DNA_START=88 /DNA_END=1854 /DNA_ORIENTATION=+